MSTARNNTPTTKPPFIVAFFDPALSASDDEGRTLSEILLFSNHELEAHHDFIQYVFPLPEPSGINPWAPTITQEIRAAFLARKDLRLRLLEALDRMLDFYGLELTCSKDEAASLNIREQEAKQPLITPSDDFSKRAPRTWLTSLDHNHLRLTRMIRCLRVLGLEVIALALYHALLENDFKGKVSSSTRMFWKRAALRPLHLPPEEADEDAEGIGWLKDGDDGEGGSGG